MTPQAAGLSLADVLAARQAISGIAARTPLVPSPYLAAKLGADFLLKLEIAQPTGAFKLRGAANAVASVPEGAAGVVCCSTGNHGRSVAYAAARRGLRAVVCLSSLVPEAKVAGILGLGGEARITGHSQDDAQVEATRLVAEEGLIEIPPFDDPRVIAGQGTIALEMLEARPDIATLLVPLSGGGLAAGVALAAKAIKPAIRVIGISMDRGAAMAASISAGHPVEVREVASLADSLGGGIGLENRLSFSLCRDLLDAVVLVTEEEIYRALQAVFYQDRLVAEGASVVGIAALLAGKLDAAAPGPMATILTGRNLDMGLFARIVAGADVDLDGKTVKGASWRMK
ncbi:threonine dehydratase [Defluviimonas sp. 20V17]|uniref:Hydroxyectoine utilization dehydratase EutB n=1 Tax=Allgaiera indica TaxID=765699 RepID=A0AAN4UT81_9RHOB|nr:hydroxyectoine utilization dehydratase EutB [Allgaiera indica]KDB01641.1 threonine dehydratase [Defluviimonas sp. 20V17]GHE03853.1 hydroxyectoine utilization dehydratase EutB [Allgaiera indica]SDX36731.1 threonine dehydratase [Allgaiera indica]